MASCELSVPLKEASKRETDSIPEGEKTTGGKWNSHALLEG